MSPDEPMRERPAAAAVEHGAELRFRRRAARGDPERGLAILNALDRRSGEA